MNTPNDTISRRSAIRTGTLAALAAGLLGATKTATAQVAPASPLIVGTVTNTDDLVADVQHYVETSNALYQAVEDVEDALKATFSPEQRALFHIYERRNHDREYETEKMYVAALACHMPGLAPALWALWDHVIQENPGECCTRMREA